jgi:hypothetical protein
MIDPVTNPLAVESTVRRDKSLGRDFAEWTASEKARCTAADRRWHEYGSGYPEARHFPRTVEHMDRLKAARPKALGDTEATK